MVADFGFIHHRDNVKPSTCQSMIWQPSTEPDTPGAPREARVARILAARAAIDAGRYELDDQVADGVAEAVLNDIA